jgi:hypothetical protein
LQIDGENLKLATPVCGIASEANSMSDEDQVTNAEHDETLESGADQDLEQEQESDEESTPIQLARANDVLPGEIHLLPVASRPFFPRSGRAADDVGRALGADHEGGGQDRSQDPRRGAGRQRDLGRGDHGEFQTDRHRLPGASHPSAGRASASAGRVSPAFQDRGLGASGDAVFTPA